MQQVGVSSNLSEVELFFRAYWNTQVTQFRVSISTEQEQSSFYFFFFSFHENGLVYRQQQLEENGHFQRQAIQKGYASSKNASSLKVADTYAYPVNHQVDLKSKKAQHQASL